MNILISVIIPAFESNKYIERCLDSILNQSISIDLFEIIVIDDGSSEPLKNFLKEKYLKKISLLHHKKNLGLPSALNTGIKNSNGRLIVRVDSDDYVHEKFLEILFLKHQLSPKLSAVSCDYFIVDKKEDHVVEVSSLNEPIGCGIMFKKQALIEIGLYNVDFKMAEEIELMQRFNEQNFSLENINIPLYRYFKHETNMTNNTELYEAFKKKK